MTIEQTLARLEEIVARLDEERMDLGEALALFEEGVNHLRSARFLLPEDASVQRRNASTSDVGAPGSCEG